MDRDKIIQELKRMSNEAHAEETQCVNEVDVRYCRGKIVGLLFAMALLERDDD